MSEKDIPGRGSPQLPSSNFRPVWPGNAWCSKQAPSLLPCYWEPPNKILTRDTADTEIRIKSYQIMKIRLTTTQQKATYWKTSAEFLTHASRQDENIMKNATSLRTVQNTTKFQETENVTIDRRKTHLFMQGKMENYMQTSLWIYKVLL